MSFHHKVAIGHDNIGGLVRMNPEPRCPGLNYAVWIPSAIGDVPQGKQSCVLVWGNEIPATDLDAALTQLGLTTTTPVAVTLTLPVGAARTTGYFNCYVSYPKQLTYSLGYHQNVEVDVRIEEQIA